MAESESNEPETLLEIEDVARLLKVSPQTVYKLARSGELKGRKVASEWRFLPSDVSAYQRGEAA